MSIGASEGTWSCDHGNQVVETPRPLLVKRLDNGRGVSNLLILALKDRICHVTGPAMSLLGIGISCDPDPSLWSSTVFDFVLEPGVVDDVDVNDTCSSEQSFR